MLVGIGTDMLTIALTTTLRVLMKGFFFIAVERPGGPSGDKKGTAQGCFEEMKRPPYILIVWCKLILL